MDWDALNEELDTSPHPDTLDPAVRGAADALEAIRNEVFTEEHEADLAGSCAEFNPLQRAWRDLETCSRHAVVNPVISTELYGRALLGVEEQVTDLI